MSTSKYTDRTLPDRVHFTHSRIPHVDPGRNGNITLIKLGSSIPSSLSSIPQGLHLKLGAFYQFLHFHLIGLQNAKERQSKSLPPAGWCLPGALLTPPSPHKSGGPIALREASSLLRRFFYGRFHALQAAPPAGQSTAARSCLPGAFLLSPARDHPLPTSPTSRAICGAIPHRNRPHRASATTSLRIKLDIVIRIGPILLDLIDCAQRNALADHSTIIGKWPNLGHSPRKLSPRSDLGPFCH